MGSKSLYVEKMPEHILRVPELVWLFPKAKFVYMRRNWVDVANSIEDFGSSFNWFGYNSIKWQHLIQFINSKDFLKTFFCDTDLASIHESLLFVRGVVEWIVCELCYL